MKRFIPLMIIIAVLTVLLYAGLQLRSELDFQTSMGSMAEIQASLQSLRAAVIRLGWIAPLAFILMVTFRYFLLLSSGLVLTVGGLVFGAVQGTLLGFIGILLSGLFHFYVGRYGGRDLVERFFGHRLDKFKNQIETAGPWVVGACVAHPAGSMGLVQTAAGMSTIQFPKFFLAVTLTAPIRAGCYAFLGATIVEMEVWVMVLAGVIIAVLGALPVLHPIVQEKLFGRRFFSLRRLEAFSATLKGEGGDGRL